MFSAFRNIALLVLALSLAACEREQRDYDGPRVTTQRIAIHYEHNAYDTAQGKNLFEKMNCTGCHAHGGGGMGPALSDNYWIYGGELDQIYHSIRDGRPNGMPAWKDRLTDTQLWQLAAYVRSMGRYVHKDVAPSRDDALQSGKAESRRPYKVPVIGEPPQ